MKKILILIIFVFAGNNVRGQETTEEKEVQQTIERFFEGFHARDSVILKSVVAQSPVLQTIGRNQSGELEIRTEDFQKFLTSITSIPSNVTFKETLHSFDIEVDGPMAHAWTPYSLFMDGNFSHCGVNSFQLFKKNDQWKIIYLIDTRRREGCEEIKK